MSNDQDNVDVDADVEPTTSNSEGDTHTKSLRKHFAKLATELTDDELSSSGVQKMLLAEIVRLETEISKIETADFREKFHAADRERAILKEREKTLIFSEILYSLGLTLGALLIGLTPSIDSSELDSSKFLQFAIGIIGALLIVGSVIAKVYKK